MYLTWSEGEARPHQLERDGRDLMRSTEQRGRIESDGGF